MISFYNTFIYYGCLKYIMLCSIHYTVIFQTYSPQFFGPNPTLCSNSSTFLEIIKISNITINVYEKKNNNIFPLFFIDGNFWIFSFLKWKPIFITSRDKKGTNLVFTFLLLDQKRLKYRVALKSSNRSRKPAIILHTLSFK